MQFANYPAFRLALQVLIDGDDVSQSNIQASTLDLIVSAGEQRVYRDVRSSTQDSALSVAVSTTNTAALPVDCLEVKSVYFPAFPSLTYSPYEVMETLLQRGNSTGHARKYSLEGDNLIFFPPQSSGTVLGRYIKRFPDISTGISGNPFFARFPDLFMYAALAESGPYIGEITRLDEWKSRYLTIAQSANEFERRRATRGSKLSTRVS